MRSALAILAILLAMSGCSTQRYANRIDEGPNSYVFAKGHEPRISWDQLVELNVVLQREFQIRESPLYELGMFVAKAAGADPTLLTAVDVVARVHDAAQETRWVHKESDSVNLTIHWGTARSDGWRPIHWTRTNVAFAYAHAIIVAEVYVMPIIENGQMTNWWRIEKLTIVDALQRPPNQEAATR